MTYLLEMYQVIRGMAFPRVTGGTVKDELFAKRDTDDGFIYNERPLIFSISYKVVIK